MANPRPIAANLVTTVRAIGVALCVAALCLLASPVHAQAPAKPSAAKPSAAKPGVAKPGARRGSSRQTWLSAEDLRLGAFKAPPSPFPFPLLGDEKAREVYVDRLGKLYKERPYKGLVPNWNRRRGSLRRTRCKVSAQPLTWVGFQNNFDSSRIFVQVQGDACGYVYRPDAKHIVIDLPAVYIGNPNLRRDILTGAFPTPVNLVHVDEIKGRGVRITIALKTRQRYLSAHLGRYVFVDVAR